MKNIELLFKYNDGNKLDKRIRKKLKFNPINKEYEYFLTSKDGIFCGDHIQEIIYVINYINRTFGANRIPIIFRCSNMEFYDKLVYVMLECIAYYILIHKQQRCLFDFSMKNTIWSEGIAFSPLNYQLDSVLLKKYFFNDLQGRHFRKVVSAIPNEDGSDLSKLYQDIRLFLVNNGVSEANSNDLAEVLAELVGNSREHAATDTLIDIDLTNTTYTRIDDEYNYYGMNTAIINFSSTLFFEPLKSKMQSDFVIDGKYIYVEEAYKYHKENFSESYDENDFYIISSFQDKISGSMKKSKMGGRGLTTLLKSLEEQADTHLCYMYTDNRITYLSKNIIGVGENKLIGFNQDSNYLTKIPDDDAIQKINTILPGTAYNLSFVIKKEWSL